MIIEKVSWNSKCLVIDDEIAATKRSQDDFIQDMALALDNSSILFAGNCEEALSILDSESNLGLCLLDCKIPLSRLKAPNYDPSIDKNYGISLLPKINVISNLDTCVYSAYVETFDRLSEQISSYPNVIGCIKKNESPKLFRKALKQLLAKSNSPLVNLFDKKTKSTTSKTFNYEDLDPKVELLVRENTGKIKFLLKRSAEDIFNIGKYLTEVKLSLSHGEFYNWLECEIPGSSRSTARFMQVYRRLKSDTLSDLNIVPSALYKITKKSSPDEALNKALELARQGNIITVDLAESLIQEYDQEKKTDVTKDSLKNKSNTLNDDAISIDSAFSATSPKKETDLNQKIVKVISRQKEWKIGVHTLTCYEPNSPSFIALLPESVSLVLAFPSHKNWNFEFQQYNSIIIFQTNYDDLDYAGLFNSVKNIVEITTEYGDIVVLAFIPEPRILMLLNELGCKVFIAEPDYNKCLSLVEASQDII